MFRLNLKTAKQTDQIAKIHWIVEKARGFEKNTYFGFIDYAKALDCVDDKKLEKLRISGNDSSPRLIS